MIPGRFSPRFLPHLLHRSLHLSRCVVALIGIGYGVSGCAAGAADAGRSPADALRSMLGELSVAAEPEDSPISYSDSPRALDYRQTVGSAQQGTGFEPLEVYVSLARDADLLDSSACRDVSNSAVKALRTERAPEPAFRLCLIAACNGASGRSLRAAAGQLEELLKPPGEEPAPVAGQVAAVTAGVAPEVVVPDASATLPAAHAAFAQTRLREAQRRLNNFARVARLRAELEARDAELATLREETQQLATRSATEQARREAAVTKLRRTEDALAAARDKLDAVSRIEREVQKAAESVDVQKDWVEPPALETEGDGDQDEDDEPPASEAEQN